MTVALIAQFVIGICLGSLIPNGSRHVNLGLPTIIVAVTMAVMSRVRPIDLVDVSYLFAGWVIACLGVLSGRLVRIRMEARFLRGKIVAAIQTLNRHVAICDRYIHGLCDRQEVEESLALVRQTMGRYMTLASFRQMAEDIYETAIELAECGLTPYEQRIWEEAKRKIHQMVASVA